MSSPPSGAGAAASRRPSGWTPRPRWRVSWRCNGGSTSAAESWSATRCRRRMRSPPTTCAASLIRRCAKPKATASRGRPLRPTSWRALWSCPAGGVCAPTSRWRNPTPGWRRRSLPSCICNSRLLYIWQLHYALNNDGAHNGLNAGHLFHLVDHAPIEGGLFAIALVEIVGRQAHAKRQDMIGPYSRTNALQIHEALHGESGTDQQHAGESELSSHQEAPHPGPAKRWRRRSAAFLQHVVYVGAAGI